MICKICNIDKKRDDFYLGDRTCKFCRKEKVRQYRRDNLQKCKDYDKKRFKDDPRVIARHKKYAATENGKQKGNKSKNKYTVNNAIKKGASNLVNNAVRDGRLIKRPCEVCGSVKRIHGHHCDYSKPLEVIWLCSLHHREWHDKNGSGING